MLKSVPGAWVFRYGVVGALYAWSYTRAMRRAGIASTESRKVVVASLVATVVFALVGVEIGARIILPVVTPSRVVYADHPTYWYTLEKGASIDMPQKVDETDAPPRRIPVHISSQGLRDREYGPKRAGEYRIALLGDSFAMGTGVLEDEMPSRQLERALKERCPDLDVTVIAAGVPGYGPWQERGFFLDRVLPLEPDLVIHEMYLSNDVHDELRRVEKYLQAYDRQAAAYWNLRRYHRHWQTRLDRWLWRHSRAYQNLMHATGAAYGITHFLSDLRFLGMIQYPVLPPPNGNRWYYEHMLRERYPDLQEGFDLIEESVLALVNDCKENGVGYMAYAQPMSTYVEGPVREFMMSSPGVTPERYDVDADVSIVEDLLREHDLPYLPFGKILREQENAVALFMPDSHLNARGNCVLADALAAYLKTKYWPTFDTLTRPVSDLHVSLVPCVLAWNAYHQRLAAPEL